jgi:hypothetical protein
MVVLADELLEQFFESSFPASFHIIDGLPSSGPATSSSSLTTFSSLGFGAGKAAAAALGGGGPASAPAAGRGLRGVLDNIVTDGMRVAAEVRRRMDEAQKELEKNAVPGQKDEDDEDEDDVAPRNSTGAYSGDVERRSVLSTDRDLLTGADAEAGADGGGGSGNGSSGSNTPARARASSGESNATRIVEFEG